MTQVNLKQLKKWLIKKDLYSFVVEMWDAYESVPYMDCWVIEYLCECFMFSVKHFLPNYITKDWITDSEYESIKNKYNAVCAVRDKKFNGQYVHNHDINIPPRHSKSSVFNVCGPVWLALNAPISVASVSHSGELSGEMNIKRQKLLNSAKFDYYFGAENKQYRLMINTAKKLVLKNGANLYLVCQDTFTGFGADVIIADDLVSAMGAARDMQTLKNTITFFRNTLPTRLNTKKTGVIWHIMQRLATGDISGVIQKSEDLSRVYSHTEIQAIADNDVTFIYPCSGKIHQQHKGDYLWQERFEDYSRLKLEVGPVIFETQYNQHAKQSDQNPIKEDYIHYVDTAEYEQFKLTSETHYASHDCAVKDKTVNDFHGFCGGYGKGTELIIDDGWEEHLDFIKAKEKVRTLQNIDPSLMQIVEDKANGAPLIQELRNDIPNIVPFSPGTNSKIQRAEIAANYMQSGAVRFVKSERTEKLINRLLEFPFVEHDDIVDACTQLIIYHFTFRQAGIYTNAFTYANIVADYAVNNRAVFYGANIYGETIYLSKLYIDNKTDNYVFREEQMFRGIDKFLDYYKTLPVSTQILDCSHNNLLYNLVSGMNINITKFIDKDREKSIQLLRVGFYKKKVLISKECSYTINDISKLRIPKEYLEKNKDDYTVFNEGFEGCVRGLTTYYKGLGGIWIT